MAETRDVGAFDFAQTDGATPVNMAQFEVPPASSGFIKGQIMALRADGATKAWSFEALVKRGAGSVVLQQALPSPINVFASAADATALATVTVSPFVDANFLGAACVGQAGQTIYWSAVITGRLIVT